MIKKSYKERLKELLSKKNSGVPFTVQDAEDFAKIQQIIKTKDYKAYCKAIRPTYKWAWFQEYIQERIDECFKKKSGRLVCKMPQQHAKSELMGRCAVSYAFGKYTEWKILYVTFSEDRAREVSADILGLITTPEYEQIFPNVQLKDTITEDVRTSQKRRNKLSINNFTNVSSKRGEFKAVGIGGTLSGYDANLIILDDFFSGATQASSKTIRDTVWRTFTNDILTRQQKEAVILIMSTQWHADDVIGRLEEYIKNKPANTPNWEFIQFNALKDERNYPYDPRKEGEYLWPEERLNVYLEKQALDPVGWTTTYQNVPPSSAGKIFDNTMFRIYDEMPYVTGMRIIISVDPNYKKDSKEGDECAIVVIGFLGPNVYLLEFSSINKVNVLDNVARVQFFIKKYPNYHAVLVEAKGQGEDIVTLLQDQNISKVLSFDPKTDSKVFRAQQMLPYCKAGQFHIPSPKVKDRNGIPLCPDIQKYMNEFLEFTGFKGGKENLVDATTQVFIEFGYLLTPLQLSKVDLHVKNQFGIGRGLTKITNHFGKKLNVAQSPKFEKRY
jgi:phage terminase large subunit-like protein